MKNIGFIFSILTMLINNVDEAKISRLKAAEILCEALLETPEGEEFLRQKGWKKMKFRMPGGGG